MPHCTFCGTPALMVFEHLDNLKKLVDLLYYRTMEIVSSTLAVGDVICQETKEQLNSHVTSSLLG